MSRRLETLRAEGVDFVSAVPCSYLKVFLRGCEAMPEGRFLAAVREDHAVSACAGAWLGGGSPVAAMQNSGLGYCLEVLSSLHLLYGIPLPILVSDRGADTDYEEHRNLGQRTRGLLDLFDIPWRLARVGEEEDDAAWVVRKATEHARPAVLLVPKEADS